MEENIAVCVRMRPLDDYERKTERELWKVDQASNSVMCVEEKGNRTISYAYGIQRLILPIFTFTDHMFGPEQISTEPIYQAVGADIVRSVMEGYNGTKLKFNQNSHPNRNNFRLWSNCIRVRVVNPIYLMSTFQENIYDDG